MQELWEVSQSVDYGICKSLVVRAFDLLANTSVVLFRAEETMQEDNRISGGLFLFWAENLIREL